MLFERIADFIMKNAKIIIAIWIVALLIAVPFMIRYNSVLQYDMDKMSTATPLESVKGQEILNSGYFNSGGNVGGGTVIIVEAYDSAAADAAPLIYSNLADNLDLWEHNKELREKYGDEYQVTAKQLGRFDDKYFENKDTQMIIYTVSYPELPDDSKEKNSAYVPDIRNIVSKSVAGVDGLLGTYVTGTDAISYDNSTGSTNDIKHIDPISVLLVLILIGLFFRSFVTAGTPPVIIGMAYGILLALVYAIGSFIGIYYITTILVLVSMLGAGCDYCIFIISRYREERKADKDHHEALRESIIWAGESIITSGISVMIGFGSLMLCSFSLVSTMGMILALGVLLALLAALTFIPSILMVVGDRIFWPSKVETYEDGSKAMRGWYGKCAAFGQRYFTHSAKSAIKYAKIIVVVTVLLSVPLVYVAVSNNASYDMIGAMPDGEAKEGVGIISKNIGGGVLMPTNITMKVDAFVDINTDADTGDPSTMGTVYSERSNAEATYDSLDGFAGILMGTETDGEKNIAMAIGSLNGDHIFDGEHEWLFDTVWNILPQEYRTIISPETTYEALIFAWTALSDEQQQKINYYLTYKTGLVSKVFEENGKEYQYVRMMVITKDEPMSALSVDTIRQTYSLKDKFVSDNAFVYEGYLSGAAVSNYEMSEMVSQDFHFIIIVVVILLILLLFVVMRSYLTPIRAVATILMSVLWTLGLTYVLFQIVLGMPVVWIVPIVLFVVCLGLGMDYDILLTTRIKEYVGKGYSNDDAIIAAVQKSGAVITLCGLIMAGAFGTMLMSSSPMLMEFGFALGFAIAVDALVIRTYIVPAIMHLMGDWNWKGPDYGALKAKLLGKKTDE